MIIASGEKNGPQPFFIADYLGRLEDPPNQFRFAIIVPEIDNHQYIYPFKYYWTQNKITAFVFERINKVLMDGILKKAFV